MLEQIKNVLNQLADFAKVVAEWFTDFIEDLVFFVTELSTTVSNVSDLIGDIFPPALVNSFLSLLTIVVVLRILGRD